MGCQASDAHQGLQRAGHSRVKNFSTELCCAEDFADLSSGRVNSSSL